MKKDTLAESAPTVILVGCYNLTDEALEKESATRRKQYIAVTLDPREAIRTGYARKNWESDGHTASNGTQHAADFLLSKLDPDLNRYGVIHGSTVPEFDHILSDEEATKIIEGEMARYDEVLAISRAAYDKRANSNTVMTPLVASYDLTREAHEELFLSGTPTPQGQSIDFVVSAREALRTGYISLDENGYPRPIGNPSNTLVKLRPNFSSIGVLREATSPPVFDHVLTAEEASKLVIEEMASYDMVLAESKAKIEADQKSEEEKKEKEAEKHRSEIDDFLTDLDYYTPRIKRGEPCVIDAKHADPCWFEMEGERVALRYDLVDFDTDSDWDTERAKATYRFFAEEREKRQNALVAKWVEEHGSSHLKKALKAGILKNVMKLCHEERLAFELPGWEFISPIDLIRKTKPRENPSESEIDALALAREKWPDGNVQLAAMDERNELPALFMNCPWSGDNVMLKLTGGLETLAQDMKNVDYEDHPDD